MVGFCSINCSFQESPYSNKCLNHAGDLMSGALASAKMRNVQTMDVMSFSKVDIVTPAQKMLARELTCDIVRGGSLLVTG